jgi:hypothetical protein
MTRPRHNKHSQIYSQYWHHKNQQDYFSNKIVEVHFIIKTNSTVNNSKGSIKMVYHHSITILIQLKQIYFEMLGKISKHTRKAGRY